MSQHETQHEKSLAPASNAPPISDTKAKKIDLTYSLQEQMDVPLLRI